MRTFFLSILLLSLSITAIHAQDKNDTLAPYQKYPTLPAFNILMMDSTSIFNTYNIPEGKPVALFFFSPDCRHCQLTTKRLVKGMDSLKDIDFYMITPVHSMTELQNFCELYHLGDYQNIKLIGRDYEFFFGSFYKIRYVPDVALYDSHKKLIKLIQGETHVKDLYDAFYSQSTPK